MNPRPNMAARVFMIRRIISEMQDIGGEPERVHAHDCHLNVTGHGQQSQLLFSPAC